MSSTPANMQQQSLSGVMTFRKSWRVYQSRLLDRLDRFLANKRLHLVAAPGSGKTVLGLEVIRRVSQPTLVLAPTITIRDQWVDRLVELFLAPGSGRPEWVSTDMRNPTFLTVATYQALHAVCSGQPEEHACWAREVRSDGIPARLQLLGKFRCRDGDIVRIQEIERHRPGDFCLTVIPNRHAD